MKRATINEQLRKDKEETGHFGHGQILLNEADDVSLEFSCVMHRSHFLSGSGFWDMGLKTRLPNVKRERLTSIISKPAAAEKALETSRTAVQHFMENEWMHYKNKVNELNLSPFRP